MMEFMLAGGLNVLAPGGRIVLEDGMTRLVLAPTAIHTAAGGGVEVRGGLVAAPIGRLNRINLWNDGSPVPLWTRRDGAGWTEAAAEVELVLGRRG